jgi:hypothetical protein
MASAAEAAVATMVADRVVVVVGIAVQAGGGVEPEGEREPAALQCLSLQLGEAGDEAVEAEAPTDDLDRVAVRLCDLVTLRPYKFIVG